MSRRSPIAVAVLAATAAAACAQTGPITLDLDSPNLDRWNYPFNPTPGVRGTATIFGATGLDGFDDRDAQFIVGFDTGDAIPTGMGVGFYRLVSARLTLVVQNDLAFTYDPTPDPLQSFLLPDDPDFIPDPTPGRPIEVYATAYRNGFSIGNWEETTPFGDTPIIPPAEGARNAFAAFYPPAGEPVDLSRQVRLGLESTPFAIGQAADVPVGELVPAETVFTFDLDPCAPGLAAFLDVSLDAGRLNLTVTSMHFAELGSAEFPGFFTKENPLSPILGYSPRLELTVIAVDDADVNGDGSLDLFDFLAFQNAFAAGEAIADFDGDCSLTLFDFLAFQNAFGGG